MKIVIALIVVVAATVVTATESGRKDKERVLKGKKSKDKDKAPLLAEIKSLIDEDDDAMSEMNGWVSLEYNDDDKMVIDYHIKEGPKRCDKCKMVIMDGDSCDDLGDALYSTEENPWSYEKTPYITNKKRRAAGSFKTDNGHSYKDNECMFVVLYDKDEDDDRRVLSSNGSRVLKGKKSKGPKKLACGQLRPDDEDEDYCD